MSKIIRTEKPSALPFYAAAAAGLALCAALPVYKVWALAVALAGAAAAFAAARRVCPPQVIEREVPFHTGDGDVDEMLTGIQKQLDTLHALNDALPDPQLSAAMDRMEKAGRSILEVVEQAPAKAKQIRRFANYYLPDAVHVLEQYAAMARQGVRARRGACAGAVRGHGPAGGAGRERRRRPQRSGKECGDDRRRLRAPAGRPLCGREHGSFGRPGGPRDADEKPGAVNPPAHLAAPNGLEHLTKPDK